MKGRYLVGLGSLQTILSVVSSQDIRQATCLSGNLGFGLIAAGMGLGLIMAGIIIGAASVIDARVMGERPAD